MIESTNIRDSEFGSGYTVKEYHSKKQIEGDEWYHESIALKPLSHESTYKDIELTGDELNSLKVVGVFDRVIV